MITALDMSHELVIPAPVFTGINSSGNPEKEMVLGSCFRRNDMNNDNIRFKGINHFHTSGREEENLPVSKIFLLVGRNRVPLPERKSKPKRNWTLYK